MTALSGPTWCRFVPGWAAALAPALWGAVLPLALVLGGCSTAPDHLPDCGGGLEGFPRGTAAGAARPDARGGQQVTRAQFLPAGLSEAAPLRLPDDLPKDKEEKEELPPPRQLPTTGLTLDQAINTALLADPKIRAGLEIINQANADLLTSSLRPNPILSADIQLLPLTRPFTVDRQGGPPQTDYSISYPIDWFLFGKRAAAMASAAAGVRVAEADYADLVRQRVRDTATAFYDVLEAKALLGLARQDLAGLRRVEEATRKAVGAGGRPVVELNRVRLDVLRSEQTLREAQTTLAVAEANLRARLGRRDADPAFEVAGDLEAPLRAQPLPIEEALTVGDANRPDIRSLRLQIAKATRDVQTERTKAYPPVAPLLDYTRQFQQKAIGFPDANSWMAAVSVGLPLFDRNQGNIAKARSVLTQNAYNLETGLVGLRAEIVQIVREFERDYRNATAVSQDQLKIAADVRDSINKAYDAGGRTLLEVLDAQRNYRETYRLYFSTRASYWRSVYKFSAALGRQVPNHDEHPRQQSPGPRP
jgi:cobalt-zinc-cadmium efflux system outer membrane protein